MTLAQGKPGEQYQVAQLNTQDEELENFLLTLGCYQGETIGLVSTTGSNFTVSIRDGRYTIDKDLADAIVLRNITAKGTTE